MRSKKFRRPIGEAHGRIEVAVSRPWRLRLSTKDKFFGTFSWKMEMMGGEISNNVGVLLLRVSFSLFVSCMAVVARTPSQLAHMTQRARSKFLSMFYP